MLRKDQLEMIGITHQSERTKWFAWYPVYTDRGWRWWTFVEFYNEKIYLMQMGVVVPQFLIVYLALD